MAKFLNYVGNKTVFGPYQDDSANATDMDITETAGMEKTDGQAVINERISNTWKITAKEVHPEALAPFEDFTVDQLDKAKTSLELEKSPPALIQNSQRFPPIKTFDKGTNLYKYSYQMNYADIELDTDLKSIRRTINLDNDQSYSTILRQTGKFNRFKVPVGGDAFSKGFGHVFFTRPKCNIMTYEAGSGYKLTDSVKNDMTFEYAYHNNLHILKQLCGETEFPHDFMLYLTNKAQGFDVSDKTLETSSYGTNLMGHSIQIGRTSEKSKVAGTFSVPYAADRDMNIYNLHNYWIKYIAGVFRGRYRPNPDDIIGKIIDYACACYYFVTAEDFETIIYWTKLYGVFPTSTPDGVLSWKSGAPITNPEPTITYAFSWRSEDNDPKIFLDFNNNALYGTSSDYKYARTYEPSRYGLGDTWVEAPFVEYLKNSAGIIEPKLRWRSATLDE